jgi:hypothetical protein
VNSPTAKRIPINEDTAVAKSPTLIELLSHAYFPGSFLIGPQVKYKNYLEYIASNENFLPKWYAIDCYIFSWIDFQNALNSWLPALTRLLVGLIYLAIYQIGSLYWPYQYLNSLEFVCLIKFLIIVSDFFQTSFLNLLIYWFNRVLSDFLWRWQRLQL